MTASTLFVRPPEISPEEFLSPSEAQKCADVRLASPPTQWSDEVLQAALRDHPYLPLDRALVTFKQRDDAAGYAFGYIGFASAPHVTIPVIIARRMLKPLDILIVRSTNDGTEQAVGDMTDDRVLPLTDATFSQAMDVGEAGQVTPANKIRGTAWTEDGSALRLPWRGRTVIASVLGASPEKRARFEKVLAEDRAIATGFVLHAPKVAEAWLNAEAPSNAARAKFASREVKLAEAKVMVDAPVETDGHSFLAAGIMLESSTSKIAVAMDAIDLTDPVAPATRYLIFEDGSYCRAPAKVATVDTGTDEELMAGMVLKKIATRGLARGDTVCLYTGDVFTEPLKISSIEVDDTSSSIQVGVTDGLKAFHVTLSNVVKTATLGPAGWVFPLTTAVLKISEHTTNPPMAPEKVARILANAVPHQLIAKDGQFTLMVDGHPFQEVAQVDEAKCAEVLGAWLSNGDTILEAAKTAGMVRFACDIRRLGEEVKEAQETLQALPGMVEQLVQACGLPLEKAMKLAAAMTSPESADAVLGTGFLNDDNVAEFVGLSDEFQEIVEKLARLLLFIRLGYPEGDEAATMVAMKSLQRVVDNLQGLSLQS